VLQGFDDYCISVINTGHDLLQAGYPKFYVLHPVEALVAAVNTKPTQDAVCIIIRSFRNRRYNFRHEKKPTYFNYVFLDFGQL